MTYNLSFSMHIQYISSSPTKYSFLNFNFNPLLIFLISLVGYWEEELGIDLGDLSTLYPGEGLENIETLSSTPELELERYKMT